MQLPAQSQQTDTTLVNNASTGPPPPVPLHTKPQLDAVCSRPCHPGEQVEIAWIQALQQLTVTEGNPNSSVSDEEYFSAEEEADEQRSDDMQPPFTQAPTTSALASDSDDELWSTVTDFDDNDALSVALSGIVVDDRETVSVADSGPSAPGPSTLFRPDTPQSTAAHPLTPSKRQKKYYVVIRGRRIGVFKSWLIVKASITGVDGIFESFDTVQEAFRAYDDARELDLLRILE